MRAVQHLDSVESLTHYDDCQKAAEEATLNIYADANKNTKVLLQSKLNVPKVKVLIVQRGIFLNNIYYFIINTITLMFYHFGIEVSNDVC